MPRRPAFARRARLPGPIFWDVALALALAVVALLTVETEQGVEVQHTPDFGVEIRPTPPPVAAGEPWNAELILDNPQTPLAPGEPRLTIQNAETGETTMYESRPTGRPGIYRVRVVFPVEGEYSYWVTGGGIEPTVTIGEPGAPPPRVPPEERATQAHSDSSPVWPVAFVLLATLPVALRRRYPLPVLAVTLTGALASDVFYGNFFFPGSVVALYTVAVHMRRPTSVHIGVATALALTISFLDRTGLQADLGNWEDAVGAVGTYAIFAASWVLGDRLGARREYLREVEERAARLEREQEESARRAAAEEQARIARELHDIIAHNVSVMTVQAAAAGDAFDTQPGKVREALASIEATGREALTELRRLLGSVRPGDSVGAFEPQPGLARIDDLVEQVRATGLEVELIVEGSPRELPPGIDLSAYRIVQEALTNTLKHAEATRATVLVRYGDGTLEIEVVDDGRGAAVDGAERGHGIIGMRERTALVGGELTVGPSANGGFVIRARIPLEETET